MKHRLKASLPNLSLIHIFGKLIAEAMEKVTTDGVITVEESKTAETYSEVVEGMMFDRGYILSLIHILLQAVREPNRLHSRRLTDLRFPKQSRLLLISDLPLKQFMPAQTAIRSKQLWRLSVSGSN